MKLSQLQEARYYKHPAVQFIHDARRGGDPDIRFDISELDSTLESLIKEFGEPKHEEFAWMTGGSKKRWIWDDFTVHQYEDSFVYIHMKRFPGR